MPEFTVKVVERPMLKTAGFKVSTTMEKAAVDCPKIWDDTFAPHMISFPADPARPCETYGVCVMTNETDFDYWAVMPLAPGAKIPDGMSGLDIQGGLYAECPVTSIKEVNAAFAYLYTNWPASQNEYAVNFQLPGYEFYTEDFIKNGSLTLRCPVTRK